MALNRLRDLRKEAGFTIAQMATIFHLQTTQYRRYEVNESDIPIELAMQFANYYKVSLDYLVYRSNEKNSNLTYNKAIKFATEVKNLYDTLFT